MLWFSSTEGFFSLKHLQAMNVTQQKWQVLKSIRQTFKRMFLHTRLFILKQKGEKLVIFQMPDCVCNAGSEKYRVLPGKQNKSDMEITSAAEHGKATDHFSRLRP